ncbi:hypothetical protein GGR57DRAFT_471106 [Xylariaceae sp. FL1272]|nr:hypothetical protein GGR57DRAFT_471106 [Xylariaceae sp. FL1272]
MAPPGKAAKQSADDLAREAERTEWRLEIAQSERNTQKQLLSAIKFLDHLFALPSSSSTADDDSDSASTSDLSSSVDPTPSSSSTSNRNTESSMDAQFSPHALIERVKQSMGNESSRDRSVAQSSSHARPNYLSGITPQNLPHIMTKTSSSSISKASDQYIQPIRAAKRCSTTTFSSRDTPIVSTAATDRVSSSMKTSSHLGKRARPYHDEPVAKKLRPATSSSNPMPSVSTGHGTTHHLSDEDSDGIEYLYTTPVKRSSDNAPISRPVKSAARSRVPDQHLAASTKRNKKELGLRVEGPLSTVIQAREAGQVSLRGERPWSWSDLN